MFAYNDEQRAHDEHAISYGRYLAPSDFGGNVMENWQIEFLQLPLINPRDGPASCSEGGRESKKIEDAGRRRTKTRSWAKRALS